MKAGIHGNFDPTGTDAIYVIDKGRAKAIAKGTELGQPNGVAWLGGTFEVALSNQKSPADIGYDTKRGRLLVPHLSENTAEAYSLK